MSLGEIADGADGRIPTLWGGRDARLPGRGPSRAAAVRIKKEVLCGSEQRSTMRRGRSIQRLQINLIRLSQSPRSILLVRREGSGWLQDGTRAKAKKALARKKEFPMTLERLFSTDRTNSQSVCYHRFIFRIERDGSILPLQICKSA